VGEVVGTIRRETREDGQRTKAAAERLGDGERRIVADVPE
jgi:hypothetical protein